MRLSDRTPAEMAPDEIAARKCMENEQKAIREKAKKSGELPKASLAFKLYGFADPYSVLGIVTDVLVFLGTTASMASENGNHDTFSPEGMQGLFWLLRFTEDMVSEVKEVVG